MGFVKNVLSKAFALAPRLKKRTFDPEAMNEDDIELPMAVVEYNKKDLRLYVKDEISTYLSLGYKNKDIQELQKSEYHSLEIGLLLRFLKEKNNYLFNTDEILPSFIDSSDKKKLHIKVFDLVKRYDNSVDKDASLEELEKNILWNALEVGYLLKYISLENRIY